MNKRKNIVRLLALLMVTILTIMNTGIENVVAFYNADAGNTDRVVPITVQLMQCNHKDTHYDANGQHIGDVSEDSMIREFRIQPQVGVDFYSTYADKQAAGLALPDTNKYIYEYEMSYAEGGQVDYAIITQPYVTHYSGADAATNGVVETHNRMYWIGEYNSSITKLTDNFGVYGEGADGEINWYDFNGECSPWIDMSLSQQTWETVENMANQDVRTFVMNPDIGDDAANGQRFIYLIEGTFMNKDIGDNNHKAQQNVGIPDYYGNHIYAIVGLVFYRTLDFDANGGTLAIGSISNMRVYNGSDKSRGFTWYNDVSKESWINDLNVSCPTDAGGTAYIKPAERTYYEFLGWYAPELDADGNPVRDSDGTVVCSDVPIYNVNGNAVLSYSVNDGVVTTYTDMSGDNASPYFEKDGTGNTVWKYSGNVTAYAKWKENYYLLEYEKGETNSTVTTLPKDKLHIGQDVYLNNGSSFLGSDYEITFDTNKGTGSTYPSAVSPITGFFPFKGWNIKGTEYDPKTDNPVPSLSNTLYETVTATAVYADAKKSLPSVTRVGYTFGGWYRDSALTDRCGTAGSTVTLATSADTVSLKLYAKWTARNYLLYFDYNVPSGADGSTLEGADIAYKTVTFDAAIGQMPSPSLAGYRFGGWYDENGVRFTETTVYRTAGSSTVYAKWEPVRYEIIYDYNGGDCDMDNPEQAGYYEDVTIYAPERNGSSFAGWTITGMDNSTHTIDGTVTNETDCNGAGAGKTSAVYKGLRSDDGTVYLTAQWHDTDYTITYHLDGAADPGNPSTYNRSTPTFSLINPSKEGYDFAGWTGTGLDTENLSVVIPTGSYGDREYTAHFNAHRYRIVYAGTEGCTAWNPGPDEASFGQTFTVDNPGMPGAVFAGWTISGMDGCEHVIGADTTPDEIISGVTATSFKNLRSTEGTVTFTAVWQYAGYNIIYDFNGGQAADGGSYPAFVSAWETFTVSTPVRDSYEFAGWTITGMDDGGHWYGGYTSSGSTLTGRKETEYRNLRYSPGTVTFTAAWDRSVRKVIFMSDGGEMTGGSIQDSWTMRFIGFGDSSFTAVREYDTDWSTDVPRVSKTGYTFLGYYDSEKDGDCIYDAHYLKVAGRYWDDSGRWIGPSVILYARYIPYNYTVTYDLDGGTWTDDGSTADRSAGVTYDSTKNNKLYEENDVYRRGYVFTGWYDANGNLVYRKNGACTSKGGYWSEDYIE